MFEHALEDCLTRMRLEGATPEECLARYPQFHIELEPVLLAARNLGALESLEPRPEFRSQTRARLLAHMRANPRRQERWHSSIAFRYAASLALLFVTLAATGTALAQGSLPGDTLYGWKLASERIWYGLHNNPVEADIYLTGRRVLEIQTIRGRANLEEIGVGAYTAILQQLSLDLAQDPEKATSVSEVLQEQKEKIKEIIENSRADLPTLDELFGIVVLPVDQNRMPPIEDHGNPNGELPLIITAVPPIKKDEGEQHAPEQGQENSAGEPGSESENRPQSDPPAKEGPGFLQKIIDGLFGGN